MKALVGELRLTPVTTVSLLLSVAVAVALWRLDVVNPGPAVIAGLMLELVLLTHRTFARMEDFERRLGQISSMPDLAQIVTQVSDLSREKGRFTQLILHTIVRSFCHQTAQLRNGRQNLSADQFMSLARAIYGNLKTGDTLFATSYFAGGEYWATKYGAEYAALNRDAHAAGAKITRIYMLRDRQQRAEKAAVLQQQAAYSSIRTLLLDEQGLADAEQRDFLVLNDQLAVEFHFAGGLIVSTIDVILDPVSVAELAALMRKLVTLSKPVGGLP